MGKLLPAVKHILKTPAKHDTIAVKDTSAVLKKTLPVTTKPDTLPAVKRDSIPVKDTTAVVIKQPMVINIIQQKSKNFLNFTEGIHGAELLSENTFARDPYDYEKLLNCSEL
jgi:hypothetical protein